jgi:hypothetical protein
MELAAADMLQGTWQMEKDIIAGIKEVFVGLGPKRAHVIVCILSPASRKYCIRRVGPEAWRIAIGIEEFIWAH